VKSWRAIADWAKANGLTLRIADRLGRGRGRFRILDVLWRPPPAPCKPDLTDWERHELAAVWIGHATVLMRMGGMNILTDPVFSKRVGIGLGLMTGGPLRMAAPALKLRELPRLDLVLVSHAHFDHLDRPTLVRLPKSVPVVAAENTADLIRDLGFREIVELRWDESTQIGNLKITAVPVKHWGARAFYDRHRGFAAFQFEAGERRVLFGSDTAYCDAFSAIGPVDLAILGIAGYDPYIHGHANPEQVWQMANQCEAKFILPMHHSTFRLSLEPMDEPLKRLIAAAGKDASRIVVREIGGQWAL